MKFVFSNRLLLLCLLIGLLSLCVRLLLVKEINQFNSDVNIENFCNDGPDYMHLARNIANDFRYSQPTIESRWIAFFRLPGYPLFLAIFEYLGAGVKSVLIAQAILGAAIPVVVTLLAYLFIGKYSFAAIAGLLSTVSPTGIGLSGMILTDILFSTFFAVGLFAFFVGIFFPSPRLIVGSGLIFGIGSLIKPVLLFWPILAIFSFYFFKKTAKKQIKWKYIFFHIAFQSLFLLGWGTHNYLKEGVFTTSPELQDTLRNYYSSEVLVLSKSQGPVAISSETLEVRKKSFQRFDEMIKGGVPFSTIIKIQTDESIAILRSDLLLTIKVYFHNLKNQLTPAWDYLLTQYPDNGRNTGMFKFMFLTISIDMLMKKIVYFLCVMLVVASIIPFGDLPKKEVMSRFYISVALFSLVLYFASVTGIGFWSGPRLIYPIECCLITLTLLNLNTLFEKMGLMEKKIRFSVE